MTKVKVTCYYVSECKACCVVFGWMYKIRVSAYVGKHYKHPQKDNGTKLPISEPKDTLK